MTAKRTFPISTGPLALLSRLLGKLDLSENQREDLKRSYKAVTTALRNAEALEKGLVSLELRPQGSVRAGTVIKPSPNVNFDLDFLCLMDFEHLPESPTDVWNRVWNALGESGIYKAMRAPKPRCIRLEFAAGYHVDITPAVPDQTRPSPALQVPDSKLKQWSPSNPIGFCDDWLKKIAEQLPLFLVSFSAANAEKQGATIENRRVDYVEPFPNDEGFEKAPLLKLIQLVKYLRDKSYKEDDPDKPSSILLTTITAQAYEAHLFRNHGTTVDFVLAVISTIKRMIKVSSDSQIYKFVVENPVDNRENFAERWDLNTYNKFSNWIDSLEVILKNVLLTEALGWHENLKAFNSSMPGASELKIGDDIGNEMRSHHDSGSLRLTAVPSMSSSAILIKPTTYFGTP